MREWDQTLSEARQGQSRTSMCKQQRQTGKVEEIMQKEQVLEEQSNQMTFKTLGYLLKIVQGSDEKHLNWGTYSKYGKED